MAQQSMTVSKWQTGAGFSALLQHLRKPTLATAVSGGSARLLEREKRLRLGIAGAAGNFGVDANRSGAGE